MLIEADTNLDGTIEINEWKDLLLKNRDKPENSGWIVIKLFN